MTASKERSLEQKEALFALQCVGRIRSKNNKELESNYFIQIKRFPAMVLTNGLGQSLAFLLARTDKNSSESSGHKALYNDIAKWLVANDIYPKEGTIIEQLMKNDMNKYMQAEQFTLRFLSWLVRFAKAYLSSDKEG